MKRTLLIFFLLFTASELFGQDFALEHLENSPRHHEWVGIESDGRTIQAFVAYPERAENTLAVIVIHENRGLTAWVRSFADQVAAAGYLAIAPDLLSEFDDEHQRTSDFLTSDGARDALYQVDYDQITRDLISVRQYVSSIPSSNGKTIVAGFCWGGSQSFRFATNTSDIEAAIIFYGSAPEEEDELKRIAAPVYGFYAENDQRINATIPETEAAMNRLGKNFEYEMYDGAGHGYMRSGDDPAGSPENRQARDESWKRLKEILAEF